jgi:murein DD-endopeptidase MepM/ murein hydrolase activator NlpD
MTVAALSTIAGRPAIASTPVATFAAPKLSATPPAAGGTVFGAKQRVGAAARAVFPIAAARGDVDYGTQINRFGVQRAGHTHGGQDVFAPAGTPLRAVVDAIVADHGSDGGRGNWIALYSARTKRTYLYFHMQAPTPLHTGQHVRAGKRVGRLGCTGNCQGAHLHFEVHRGHDVTGHGIDPLPSLRRWQKAR